MALTIFGTIAVAAMLLMYALEDRSHRFILGFALASVAVSAYSVAIEAWPIAVLEAVWALGALRRWRRMRLAALRPALSG